MVSKVCTIAFYTMYKSDDIVKFYTLNLTKDVSPLHADRVKIDISKRIAPCYLQIVVLTSASFLLQ